MSKITSTIAATLIATASFATAALASGGTYYEGAVEPAPSQSVASSHQAAPKALHTWISRNAMRRQSWFSTRFLSS